MPNAVALRLYDVPIGVKVRIGLWEKKDSFASPICSPRRPLNIGPRHSRAVVVLKKDVGSSIHVHVAHADDVPTRARVAKVEACGISASRPLAVAVILRFYPKRVETKKNAGLFLVQSPEFPKRRWEMFAPALREPGLSQNSKSSSPSCRED
jgi:hypothetical protein